MADRRLSRLALASVLLGLFPLVTGCQSRQLRNDIVGSQLPRELAKVSLPTYVVEPPDILLIQAVRSVRLPTDKLKPLDSLLIQVSGTLPVEVKPLEQRIPEEEQMEAQFKQINGVYRVLNDGTVDLGPYYGKVRVQGMTLDEAKTVIDKHLKDPTQPFGGLAADAQVSVSLPDLQGDQPITGDHLVRPDGTVGLGIYGSVHVAGLSLDQAKLAVEEHLADYILGPEIDLDVLAYNSKVYYVITDGGGLGEFVYRLPITGNETVLDAIGQVQGLPAVASKKGVWIARPAPAESGCEQILPVDWNAIAQGGSTRTNYQILPGDRIYIQADHWITIDSFIAKVTQPFERLFGFTLLGEAVQTRTRFIDQGSGGGGFGGGGFGVGGP